MTLQKDWNFGNWFGNSHEKLPDLSFLSSNLEDEWLVPIFMWPFSFCAVWLVTESKKVRHWPRNFHPRLFWHLNCFIISQSKVFCNPSHFNLKLTFLPSDEEFQDAVERKEAAFLAAHLKLTAHLDTQDSRHTSIALLLKDLLAKNFPKVKNNWDLKQLAFKFIQWGFCPMRKIKQNTEFHWDHSNS